MSDESVSHSDGFDAALQDALPDDLESVTPPEADQGRDHSGNSGWISNQYTVFHAVTPEQAIEIGSDTIRELADGLKIPDSTEQMAVSTFKQFIRQDPDIALVELYAAAAFYCGGKMSDAGLTPDAVVEAGPELLTHNRLLRRSKSIATTLGLDASMFWDVTQYIDRFCSELSFESAELAETVRKRARDNLGVYQDAGLDSGRSPTGLAAAAVYLAGRETGADLTQDAVAEVAGVTTVTIRNRYQEQAEFIKQQREKPTSVSEAIQHLQQQCLLSDRVVGNAELAWQWATDQTTLAEQVTGDELDWAAGAILYASNQVDGEVTATQLKTVTRTSAGDLESRRRKLKQAIRTTGVWQNTPPENWNLD